MKKIMSCIALIAVLLTTITAVYAENIDIGTQNDKSISSNVTVAKPKFPEVRRTSSTSLQIKWKKVADASGYAIYRYNSNKKKYRKVKTINRRNTTKWTNKKLTENKTYRYKIKSFKRVNDRKIYSGFTYSISAKTYVKRAKKVNVGKVTAKNKVTIGIAGKVKVKTSIKPAKYGNAKKKSVISKNIRFISANPNIVVDGKEGTLRGKTPGTTNVYAVAHNGNLNKIRVTIKDYARPVSWWNLNEVSPDSRRILLEEKDDLASIASFFSTHPKSQDTVIYLNQNGSLYNKNNVTIAEIEDTIYRFLNNCQCDVVITVNKNSILFDFSLGTNPERPYIETIMFRYNKDISEENAAAEYLIKIAPQWFWSSWRVEE
jgi:hypothetical protein